MNKIQIFQGRPDDLMKEINDWLKANQPESIKFVTQSQGEGGTLVTISLCS